MRRRTVYIPLIAISIVLFVLASQTDNTSQALFLAFLGALVPVLGAMALLLVKMVRWRRMGAALKLIARGTGAYPDLVGRYQGKRLIVRRRTDPFAGTRESTAVRIEGQPEILLPGTVGDPDIVRSVLAPLLEDAPPL